jgi:chromosome segregation ATPase
MSKQIDNFTNSLRDKLNDLDNRLSSIKMTVDSASQESQASIEAKLKEVKTKLETKREDFNTYKLELKKQAEEKQSEIMSKIDNWKTNRELENLDRRAVHAEEYAARGVAVAMAAIEEAEEAILEAIAARLDANNAHNE